MKDMKAWKLVMMFMGVGFIGFSVFLLRLSDFGTDPFTTMNLGMSSFLQLSFGNFQLIMNAVLLIVVVWVSRRLIGLGTLGNMVLVGYLSDFFVMVFNNLYQGTIPMFVRIIIFIFAVLLMSFGVAMYMLSELGVAPYDALPVIIESKTDNRFSFQNSRVLVDIVATLTGFLFGATVGIGTVITGLFMGPIIQIFKKRIEEFLSKHGLRMIQSAS